MNVFVLVLGAVLLALTAMLPALTSPFHNPGGFGFWTRFHLKRGLQALRGFDWRDALWDESGVVAITYTSAFTNNGTSTPPTATQASLLVVQTAEVFFADTDTQAVIVHNWGADIQYPAPASWSSFLLPLISYYKLLGGASDSSFATNFTFGLTNTNSVTMNKISIGTGSGGTYAVIMRRVLG